MVGTALDTGGTVNQSQTLLLTALEKLEALRPLCHLQCYMARKTRGGRRAKSGAGERGVGDLGFLSPAAGGPDLKARVSATSSHSRSL